MPTLPYDPLASKVRNTWSLQAQEISERLGTRLEYEIDQNARLGTELRAARIAADLTQPELATASLVQQAEISRIENGLGNPTMETLQKLAAPLGMRLALMPVS